MDVEITISYSEERARKLTVRRPDTDEILYQIVTPAAGIPQSFVEGLREARRVFGATPWPAGKPR